MGICDVPYDESGYGYYANCNPQPRWGAGVKFPSQAACYNACVASGDAGCGNCTYVPPRPTPITKQPPLPSEPPTIESLIEDKKGIKLLILAVIAFILLSRS